MGKMQEYEDQIWKHYQRGLHRVEVETPTPGWPHWLTATYGGPYGDVSVTTFRMLGKEPRDGTSMDLSMDGYRYDRRWEHCFGTLTLARLAREFQEEIYIRCKVKTLELDDTDLQVIKDDGEDAFYIAIHLSEKDIDLIKRYL